MAVSKAQQKATNKYISKAYDRVNLTLPKGQKDVVQAHASARGESVNGFIGRAISETMERDSGEMPAGPHTKAVQTPPAAAVSLPPETQERAGEATDTQGEGKTAVWLSGSVDLPPRMMEAVEGLRAKGETPVAVLWRAIAALDANATQAAGVVVLSVETVRAARAAADRNGESVEDFLKQAVETVTRKNSRKKF